MDGLNLYRHHSETATLKVGPQGRLVIPVNLRRVLDLEPGAELVARAVDGQLDSRNPGERQAPVARALPGLAGRQHGRRADRRAPPGSATGARAGALVLTDSYVAERSLAYVLDASALLAFLQREPGGEFIENVLGHCVMSAVNWAEVLQRHRARGIPSGMLHSELTAFGFSIYRVFGFPRGDRRRSFPDHPPPRSFAGRPRLPGARHVARHHRADRRPRLERPHLAGEDRPDPLKRGRRRPARPRCCNLLDFRPLKSRRYAGSPPAAGTSPQVTPGRPSSGGWS